MSDASVSNRFARKSRAKPGSAEEGPLRTLSATVFGAVIAISVPLALAAQVPVQTFATAAGEVKITPIAHATAMIQVGGDVI